MSTIALRAGPPKASLLEACYKSPTILSADSLLAAQERVTGSKGFESKTGR
ncbi:MAG: hypothetical protein ACJASL_004382 [Paraglaciecola sp.]|jgi:hypothetical protein